MPRQYSSGGRAPRGQAAEPIPGKQPPQLRTMRERFVAMRNVPRFLALIWNTSRTISSAMLVLRLVRALFPVATLYIAKLIIDEVVRLAALPNRPSGLDAWFASGLLDTLLWFIALEFGLAILADVLGRVVSLLDSLLGERFAISTSIRLMEHAATLDLKDFEDSETQDKLERARQQAGRVMLMPQLLGIAETVVTVISLATGLVVFAPWLIVLLVVALVPSFLGEAHFSGQQYAMMHARTQDRRELDYVRYTGANVEAAKEVKIFGLHGFLIERFRRLSEAFYRENRKLAVRRASWGSLLTTVGTIGYYAAYAYIVWRTLSGQFSIGDLTFLAGSFRQLRSLIAGLLMGFTSLASQALYLDDFFSFFEMEPTIKSPPNPRPFPRPIARGFDFEDVGFTYAGAERWAVRHLTFTLNAGEVLALVGENGAGKTTLVKLLARLYDPVEGRILLDGHDLREYDLDDLRANIGVIFQDFVRYHLTAAENIAVGRIEARDDQARIEAAAARSLADEMIRKLPDGYKQVIGKRFRTGVDLSGGEWQKVAIARAYMRDAQLLILDEPTASLDARSEFQVFQRFKELSADKTAVIISHRFSSVRMADRILVMHEGVIEAMGTHEELLAQRGRYAELFELQAAGYR